VISVEKVRRWLDQGVEDAAATADLSLLQGELGAALPNGMLDRKIIRKANLGTSKKVP
jgi:hypothetical protein